MTPFTPARLREIAGDSDASYNDESIGNALRFAAAQGEELARKELALNSARDYAEQYLFSLNAERAAHEETNKRLMVAMKALETCGDGKALLRQVAAHAETKAKLVTREAAYETWCKADARWESEKAAHAETRRRLEVADKMLNELSADGALREWLKASASR